MKELKNNIIKKDDVLKLVNYEGHENTNENFILLNKNPKKVEEIIDLVIKSGGVDYAKKTMMMYQKQALEILLVFPKNKYRDSLEKLVNYVIERKK